MAHSVQRFCYILADMTKHELELAYLRAMFEWMTEEHKTRMLVMQQDAFGFSEQLEKEKAAHLKCREAQRVFIEGPKD